MSGFRIMTAALALSATAAAVLHAQEAPELRGTVVSAETGDVVAGAWIALQGQRWGTFSWNDGHFFLPEIPARSATYEVNAVGYQPATLTLDPSSPDLVVELAPDAEVMEGLDGLMDQLNRRRMRSGQLRVFDRESLAFHGYFDLRDFLAQRRIENVRRICLDERREQIGLLDRAGHGFYMAEYVGGFLRLYTDEFIERAARERLQLHPEPRVCRGPIDTSTD